ncbi:MAG: glycosyltransferase [bacterium]
MQCSIIVPTYNRAEYLKKCVDALLNLDCGNDFKYNLTPALTSKGMEIFCIDYEIIIVDDNSTDGTREYLSGLANKKIRILHNERNLGPAISRNRGVENASYDIVAFIDDDCVADKNWLRELAGGFGSSGVRREDSGILHPPSAWVQNDAFFRNEDVDFVFGRTYYIEKEHKGYFPERLVNVKNWPGAGNMAFKKKIFNKLGGFDNNFYYYHNEDSELAIRAVENNFTFKYIDDAIVYHQAMNWNVKSLLASARNASVWVKLKNKYPKSYRILKPPVFGGFVVNGIDYFYILFLPVLLPILFIRYLLNGKRDIKMFFTKWPFYLFLRRYYIYNEAIKNRIFML